MSLDELRNELKRLLGCDLRQVDAVVSLFVSWATKLLPEERQPELDEWYEGWNACRDEILERLKNFIDKRVATK